MTIGKKISLACVALVALTIILGTVSILNVGRINTAVESIVVDSLPGEASIGRLDSLLKDQQSAALTHMLVESADQRSQADSSLAEAASKFQTEARGYEKTITTARDRELFGGLPLRTNSSAGLGRRFRL